MYEKATKVGLIGFANNK